MRISDWSSDVCSSDLKLNHAHPVSPIRSTSMKLRGRQVMEPGPPMSAHSDRGIPIILRYNKSQTVSRSMSICSKTPFLSGACFAVIERSLPSRGIRSEEHTSELQSLMRISYAVFCLQKK